MYSSKPVFPYWKFERFDKTTWSDTECQTELHFAKADLSLLLKCLMFPDKITCQQQTICSGMKCLYILLKRLAYACRYTDIAPHFGRNPSEICFIFNKLVEYIYVNHNHRLCSWDQPFLQPDTLHSNAEAIHQHGAPLTNCFGFIDGTLHPTARPKYNQRVLNNFIYLFWP